MKRTWIFQGNPDNFDIDGYISNNTDIIWLVNQGHLSPLMSVGDVVYLWRASGKEKVDSGIVASAFITSLPSLQGDDPSSLKYWRSAHDPLPKLRIKLRVEKVANKKQIIKRDWLQNDPILYELSILKMAQATNYLVPAYQEARLRMLWERTGEKWTRNDSIAGLWTYYQLLGKSASKTKDSLIAKSAVLVGRAVNGMYSKVQNFVAIDPADPRTGLDAGGEMDRQVFKEFYNETTKSINADILNAEFERIWGNLAEADEDADEVIVDLEGEALQTTKPKAATTRRNKASGQGPLRNPLLIRAIEMRAVGLAIEHFKKGGFEVTDTGSTESYDLCCIKSGIERRVEVKGTKTNGTTIILTKAEVEHAREQLVPVDLVIVRNIEILNSPEGPIAIGGDFSILENWIPEDDSLTIATYTYRL